MIELAGELVKEVLLLVSEARTASAEKLAAIEAMLRASLAALKGEKTAVHQEMDARLKALQDELEALKGHG